ncbi:Myb/SANT-like domain [Sesbania bispinosa]|nr:Myb/SANT-like domain [Sesbania bispinosa]
MVRWMSHCFMHFVNNQQRGTKVMALGTPTHAYLFLRLMIGLHITKDNVKNHIKPLKDRWKNVFDIFKGMSGFAWNPTTRRFKAEEEVWEELIKESSNSLRFIDLSPLYDILLTFSASGKHAMTAKEKMKQWEKEKDCIDLTDNFEYLGMNECYEGENGGEDFKDTFPVDANFIAHKSGKELNLNLNQRHSITLLWRSSRLRNSW